jgi:hypothetical protein
MEGILMMKMSKKVALVFCLLISMFLVPQVHAGKKYFIILAGNQLSVYDVPKDWSKLGNPIGVIYDVNRNSSVDVNSKGTIVYAGTRLWHEGAEHDFYKLQDRYSSREPFCRISSKYRDLGGASAHDKFLSGGFNPNDGTFYTINITPNIMGAMTYLSIYNIDPDAYPHVKEVRKIENWPFESIIFKPDDPTTVIGGGKKILHLTQEGALDKYTYSEKEQIEFPGKITGFSPSGDIFFSEEHIPYPLLYKVNFFKTPKKGEHWDSADAFLGTFSNERGEEGRFLDNEHFCTYGNGISIYRVPLCGTWTKNSISNKSLQKIASYGGDNFMLYNPPPPTKNEIDFKHKLEEGKPRGSYQDVKFLTGGATTTHQEMGTTKRDVVFRPFFDKSTKFYWQDVKLDPRATDKQGLFVKGYSSQESRIVSLQKMKFNKGECFAIRGNLANGGIRFGLLNSDESKWVVQTIISSNGDFDISVKAPETGEYIPMICAYLPEENRPIEFTITEISHP